MPPTALTFDTQTVFANSFAFESGLLAQLTQFKTGPIQIVVTDVVVREIERRLVEKTRETLTRLNEAQKSAARFGIVSEPPPASLDAEGLAKARIDRFLGSIGAEVISSETVSLPAILERYFNQSPPFSSTKEKEFPDAISLVALEQWCQVNDERLIAVSGDKDWQRFAAESDLINWVEKLGDAIESLLGDVASAQSFANWLLDEIQDDIAFDGSIAPMFRVALADELGSRRFAFEAECDFDILRQESAEVSLHRFSESSSAPARFRVIRSTDSSLALEIPMTIAAEALTTFETEGRTLPGATATVQRTFEFETDVLAVFYGDIQRHKIEEISVDVLMPSPITIDLGAVDSDIRESWEHYT